MKVFFFLVLLLAAGLSLAGVKNIIVDTVGCIAALAFSTIVFYQIYKAWHEDK